MAAGFNLVETGYAVGLAGDKRGKRTRPPALALTTQTGYNHVEPTTYF
jgi:hypothetical protein